MPHINDFPVNVLWQILYWVAVTPAKRLSEWKKKLPLVAVCRAWTKLAQPLVFYHVYIEYVPKCDDDDDDEPLIDASSNDACTVCTSNAELLIARQCTLMARRLAIDIVDSDTSDYLRHIALDILQLDRVDWMYINTLNLGEYFSRSWFSDQQVVYSESDEAEFARTMQYFGQNVRNIVELNMLHRRIKPTDDILCANFAFIYGGQLQILRAQGLSPLPISHLSRHISVLELTLDSSAARLLPSICGETLRVLKLSSVPRNFAWHHFRYDVFVRPIVFPRLTILGISYKFVDEKPTEDEVQSKVASGALNCDQLCFPVLKKLEISNCTPDCDLLYADAPLPKLEKVHLTGPLDEIRHCSRLKLNWVGDLLVNVYTERANGEPDFYTVTNHLFSSIFIGRTACLDLDGDHSSIDPELIRWANLTSLSMYAVSYKAFCKLIARLPNLTGFETTILGFDLAQANTFSIDESLFHSVDLLLAWGAKLAMIKIVELDDSFPLSVSICGIQALILHAGALRKFTVPRSARSSVAAFIHKYKDRHTHLADIELPGQVYC